MTHSESPFKCEVVRPEPVLIGIAVLPPERPWVEEYTPSFLTADGAGIYAAVALHQTILMMEGPRLICHRDVFHHISNLLIRT